MRGQVLRKSGVAVLRQQRIFSIFARNLRTFHKTNKCKQRISSTLYTFLTYFHLLANKFTLHLKARERPIRTHTAQGAHPYPYFI